MKPETADGAYQALYHTLVSMDAPQRFDYLSDEKKTPNPKRLELFFDYLSRNTVELTSADTLEQRIFNAKTLIEISGVVSLAYGIRLAKGKIKFSERYLASKERSMDDLRTRLMAKIDKEMADLEAAESKKAQRPALKRA